MKTCVPRSLLAGLMLALTSVGFADRAPAAESEDALIDAVAAVEEAFTKAFNAAQPEALLELFAPEAELITEVGNLYRGREELKSAFTRFFEEFPGTKVGLDIESIRPLGANLAIEEGTRFLGTEDEILARVRYVAILTKQDDKWLLSSIREFDDTPAPTVTGRLEPLAWMVGDWVSESPELTVKIEYRWADEESFLIGKFVATAGDEVVMKSEQRIGWDATTNKVRSWMFDADGGFAQGYWTPLEEGWVIKSQATSPDGTIGFATVTISEVDENHFRMVGSDRIVGDDRLEDFELVVTKAPPTPAERAQTSFVPGGVDSKATTAAPAAPASPTAQPVSTPASPPKQ
ncbi:MAG: SgcJ/EcaC family oxidoreductase [Planctomycetaceae bacterium]|nr:MAG: SgcJ/EcaC family oxidoreductase [Planctomycetaceae bacterium]